MHESVYSRLSSSGVHGARDKGTVRFSLELLRFTTLPGYEDIISPALTGPLFCIKLWRIIIEAFEYLFVLHGAVSEPFFQSIVRNLVQAPRSFLSPFVHTRAYFSRNLTIIHYVNVNKPGAVFAGASRYGSIYPALFAPVFFIIFNTGGMCANICSAAYPSRRLKNTTAAPLRPLNSLHNLAQSRSELGLPIQHARWHTHRYFLTEYKLDLCT